MDNCFRAMRSEMIGRIILRVWPPLHLICTILRIACMFGKNFWTCLILLQQLSSCSDYAQHSFRCFSIPKEGESRKCWPDLCGTLHLRSSRSTGGNVGSVVHRYDQDSFCPSNIVHIFCNSHSKVSSGTLWQSLKIQRHFYRSHYYENLWKGFAI